jgi:autotransporter-associated beta strand protein
MTMRPRTLKRHLALVVSAALAAAPPATAQTFTWVGPSGNIWQNPVVWNPIGVPGAGNDVIFTDTGAGAVQLAISAAAHSLTFNTTTGSYGLSCLPPNNQTLFGLTAITVAATDTATQGINLIGANNGTLAFPGSGSAALTITNNSPVTANPTLVISSRGIGTTGDSTAGITVTGAGYTNFNTPFIGGGGSTNPVTGGLTKTGSGTLAMTSNVAALSGTVTLAGGTLLLDYSNDASNKLGTGNSGGAGLALSGGVLTLKNTGSTSVLQNVGTGATVLDSAHTDIQSAAGTTASTVLYLAGINRNGPGTLDVAVFSPVIVQTANSITNGILGGWATAQRGGTWATAQSGTIVPFTAYGTNVFGYNPSTNTDVTASTASGGDLNSLRFSAPGVILNGSPGGTTLESGGILIPYGGSGSMITNCLLHSATGELIVHAYGDFTINRYSLIANNGLTKTGPGTLSLGGDFDYASGGLVNVNQGTLRITSPSAFYSLTGVDLNDRSPGTTQALAFQLDDGQSVASSIPIVLRGGANLNNLAQNSRISLTGVISSVPAGTATPLTFTSAYTSGVTLSGNTNTFTGTVGLYGGFLGIPSNAALGDATNRLVLGVGSDAAGGLELLANGINLARPLYFADSTRVLNYGANVDTISGVISSGNGWLVKDGTGTLVLTGANTMTNGIQVNSGTLKVASLANLGPSGPLYLAGGTLAITGIVNLPVTRSVFLGPFNGIGTGAIDVAANQSVQIAGPISDYNSFNQVAAGALLKTGPGLLILGGGNNQNSYSGGTTVLQGFLDAQLDGSLGAPAGPVTIGPSGRLTYTNSATTSRPFTMNGGTLAVASGQTLSFSGSTVTGGFLTGTPSGPGNFAVTGTSVSTIFNGVTTVAGTILNQNGLGYFTNFTNGGALVANSGTSLTQFTNQGSGSIVIGAFNGVTVAEFQSYGVLTLNPGTSSAYTVLTNIGSSPLFFNGGSRTFIGTPGTAAQFAAGFDLNGKNAIVAGGLFVNNGFVVDSSNGGNGTSTIVADFGALVKGAGFFQNSVITQNGGKLQAGNSPGSAGFGRFVFGPGGVNNYVFAIDNATGVAGPSPDAAGHVSGWGLIKSLRQSMGSLTTSGDFIWTATPTGKLTLALDTLVNATTVGNDVAGLMDHFDPAQSYSWLATEWTGTYSGPTEAAMLNASTSFDTSGFLNPIAGTFGWSLDMPGQTLSLVYTPSAVPEPGTLALCGLAAAVGWFGRRWRSRGM